MLELRRDYAIGSLRANTLITNPSQLDSWPVFIFSHGHVCSQLKELVQSHPLIPRSDPLPAPQMLIFVNHKASVASVAEGLANALRDPKLVGAYKADLSNLERPLLLDSFRKVCPLPRGGGCETDLVLQVRFDFQRTPGCAAPSPEVRGRTRAENRSERPQLHSPGR